MIGIEDLLYILQDCSGNDHKILDEWIKDYSENQNKYILNLSEEPTKDDLNVLADWLIEYKKKIVDIS